MGSDLRYAVRMLAKHPGFTAVVVLTLALGIGANTAILSLLDRLMLLPLPAEEPKELIHVGGWAKSSDGERYAVQTFNYPIYVSYRDEAGVFSGLAAFASAEMTLGRGESANRVQGMPVSGNYFSVLGVKPVLGRTFLAQEDGALGGDPVAVISCGLWQRQFASDPTVIGKTIEVDDHLLSIVGVLPAEFTGTIIGVTPEVYVPLNLWAYIKGIAPENRSFTWLYVIGRLQPGMSRPQAQAALCVLAHQIHEVEPNNTELEVVLSDGSRGHSLDAARRAKWPLALFLVAGTLSLMIACANVANILLARATTRQKEIAVRLAVGASRSRVIRQLLLENGLFALLGGGGGVLVAVWFGELLAKLLNTISSVSLRVNLDGRMLLLTLLVAAATAVAFGLVPALRASQPWVASALKDGAGSIEVLAGRWSIRHLLVIAQVAVSVMLLVLGGLCLRSLSELHAVDPGYDTKRILALSVDRQAWYSPGRDVRQILGDLRERIAAWPGVETTSLAGSAPLSESGAMTGVRQVDQYQVPANEELIWDFGMVTPSYFRTLGVPFLRGRDFSDWDVPGTPQVMIINEVLAQRYWPNEDPIGKRVVFASDEVREVIGVVKSVKLRSIREEGTKPIMYWPLAQVPFVTRPVLLVRSAGDARELIPAIRQEVLAAGLSPPVCDVRTIAQRTWARLASQRIVAGVLNAFGIVGLWLVATGIYGIIAYAVSQRTREIALRMALGAQVHNVMGMVLRKGAVLTVAGLGVGAVLSLIISQFLSRLLPGVRLWDRNFLFGIGVWDAATYLGVVLLLAGISSLACWLPARRATTIDPMVALRME